MPNEPVDLAMLAGLAQVVEQATAGFEAYDYSSALEAAEKFFWQFCDDYLELVKERAYGSSDDRQRLGSGRAAGRAGRAAAACSPRSCRSSPRRCGPGGGTVRSTRPHGRRRPISPAGGGDAALLDDVATALIGIRGAKSQAKVSMKTEATRAEFVGPADVLDRLAAAEDDLRAVGRIRSPLVWTVGDAPLTVTVELKPAEPAAP